MKAELLVLYVRVNFGLRAIQTCSIIAWYTLFVCSGYCFDCWMRQTNHFKSLPGCSLVSNYSEILQPHNELGLIWIDKKAWFQPFNKREGFARPHCQVGVVSIRLKRACLRNCSLSQMVHLGTCSIFNAIKLRKTDDGKQKKSLPDNKATVQSCDSWVPILPMLEGLVHSASSSLKSAISKMSEKWTKMLTMCTL